MADCQNEGQDGFSSSKRTSLLESSERVVSEELFDSDEASERLWLPASDGETGTAAGAVSPGDAGCCLMLCWMLPRERMRPKEARREWLRRDLTDGALDLGWESTLSARGIGEAEGGGGGGVATRRDERASLAATSGWAVACGGLVAQRESWPGEGGCGVVSGVHVRGAVECL